MAKEKKQKGKVISQKTTGQPQTTAKPAHVKEAFTTKMKVAIGAALAVLAMLVYSPSHDYDFVYDDDAVVKSNRFVHKGLGGLGDIWTTSYFQGYDENINARAFRPVPLSTLALEYEVWGLNAKVNHVFNLLFYGLTAFFLFLFLSKLLRAHHPALPIISVLFFLLHPIHLEVVANIKSRDTMLGFLGFCMAGWFLLKHVDNRKIAPLLLAILCYFVGLFSKEEVLTTLAIIPLSLWVFRKISFWRVAGLTAPFFVAAAVFLLVRSNILGGLNAGVELTHLDNSLLAANGFAERSASNLLVLGHYLKNTVFPHPLISDYSFSTIPLTHWGDWRVYISLLANLSLLGLGIYGCIKRRIWGFAALWYFITVSMFSSLFFTNVSAYNDRFLYVPVLGICLLMAWGICQLIKKGDGPETVGLFLKRNFPAAAITAILCAVGIAKIENHLPVWKDRYALFEHDVKLTPNNARTRKNYGGSLARLALEQQNTDNAKMREYAEAAIREIDASLAIYPKIPTGLIHKGNCQILLQQYPAAETTFKEALKLASNNYYARSSLANVLYRQGRYAEAIDVLQYIDLQQLRESDKQLIEKCRAAMGVR